MLLLAEALGGDIDQLSNQRAWIMLNPLPFMEVESAWSRVAALQAPDGIDESDFFSAMAATELLDVTIPPNTTAVVHVPCAEGAVVTEGGGALEASQGVRVLGREDDGPPAPGGGRSPGSPKCQSSASAAS